MTAPIGEAAAWQLAAATRLGRRRRAATVLEWVDPTWPAASSVGDPSGEIVVETGDALVRITTAGVVRETVATYPDDRLVRVGDDAALREAE